MTPVAVFAFLAITLGTASAETLTVQARNYRYEPDPRMAAVGDVIRWTFTGDPHTVTSGAPGAPDGWFDSGVKNPGETFQVTMTQAGTFAYFCAIHPEQMFGTIVVTGSAATPPPTPKPTAKPTARPTARPTATPTARPTARPTASPTARPTATPTAAPTPAPTPAPTVAPTPTASPTPSATPSPSATPTASPSASAASASPSAEPSASPGPATPAAAVDPVPIVIAGTLIVLGLIGGGLALARRAGRF